MGCYLPTLNKYAPAGKFSISVCLHNFKNIGFSKCPKTLLKREENFKYKLNVKHRLRARINSING